METTVPIASPLISPKRPFSATKSLSELGARRRHSRLLRKFESRMDHEVCRAPRGRSTDTSPDPEMAKGGVSEEKMASGQRLRLERRKAQWRRHCWPTCTSIMSLIFG